MLMFDQLYVRMFFQVSVRLVNIMFCFVSVGQWTDVWVLFGTEDCGTRWDERFNHHEDASGEAQHDNAGSLQDHCPQGADYEPPGLRPL